MKKHTKIYMDALGYNDTDYMPCELTGAPGVDIHHIVNREDRIENLMLLTREKHQYFGEIKAKMSFLLTKHEQFLIDNRVKYDKKWFRTYLKKYSIYDY